MMSGLKSIGTLALAALLAMAAGKASALHNCEKNGVVVYSKECLHAPQDEAQTGTADPKTRQTPPSARSSAPTRPAKALAQASPDPLGEPNNQIPDLKTAFDSETQPASTRFDVETKSTLNSPVGRPDLKRQFESQHKAASEPSVPKTALSPPSPPLEAVVRRRLEPTAEESLCSDQILMDLAAAGDLEAIQNCRPSGMQLAAGEQRRIGEGRTPLHWATANQHLEVMRYLIAQGSPLEFHARADKGATPLHLAAETGRIEPIQLLLNAGADIRAEDLFKLSPLHRAIQAGQLNSADYLLSQGADINARDRAGKTPLMLACRGRNTELVKLLLGAGADPSAISITGMTAVHYAAQHSPDALQLLVESGVDIDKTTPDSQSPLMLLASRGIDKHWTSIRHLIEQGAAINGRNAEGQTLFDLSLSEKHLALFRLLLDKGARPDAIKLSQLHGRRQFIELLIQRGIL